MAAMCQSCGAEHATWTGSCPHCGSQVALEMKPAGDPMLDRVVGGRYRITRKLGQGGMGSVYLAEHVGVGQRVAIKFLNPNFSGNPDLVRRFLNEAKSYGQLSHPHAVQLHDFGQDADGTLYISMEYVEGTDLKRELEQRQQFSLEDSLDVVLQVCEVLGYAHSTGIVHRDLKPENIMLVKGLRGYHAKVLDFGIARLMGEQGTRLTAAGSICGTPRYMSPEQAEGRDVDHRTDIYALGLVLFELITGVHPFSGHSIAETLRKQVVEPMPHFADVAPDLAVPEGLDRVVQKAVAKQREQRFESMGEFAAALLALAPAAVPGALASGGEAFQATLLKRRALEKTSYESSPYSPNRRAPRRALAPALVAVVLVGAGGAAGYALLRRGPPPVEVGQERPPAHGAFDTSASASSPVGPSAAQPTASSATVTAAPAPAASASAATASPDTVPAAIAEEAGAGGDPDQAAQPGSHRGGDDTASVRLLAESAMLAQANNEYLAGRLATAAQMLKAIPADSPMRRKVVDLEKQIDELSALMRRADAHYRKGRCEEAIELYEQVRRRNPGVTAAGQGIARCRREMPAATLE
ncbi:MAG: protein kinase domain-containing protein [Myxococcales bacterium]|jgi:serine/threonine protein kinase